MFRTIATGMLFPVLYLMMFTSCDDGSSDLQKEKEMRLLRQYLEANNITVEPEKSGLYFISSKEGSGPKPSNSDWVIIEYTARTINERIFDTTDEETAVRNNIHSQSVIYGDRRTPLQAFAVAGLKEGLQIMHEGGKATLIIPSHLGYGSSGSGRIGPYTTLVYDVELLKVINDPAVYEQNLINDYILKYADSTHLSVEKKESGLYFIELAAGTGEDNPEDDDIVEVFYRGTLTDGREFDTNIGRSAFKFTIGAEQAIPGFEEGVRLIKTEGRARIVVPSELGYGAQGSGEKIVGYTPLVFEIELADIQNP